MVEKFGKRERVLKNENMYDNNQGSQVLRVVHMIEPNDGRDVTSKTDKTSLA